MRSKRYRKRITTRSGEKVIAYKEKKYLGNHFFHSIDEVKARRIFENKLTPEFEKFFKKHQKKKGHTRYLFRTRLITKFGRSKRKFYLSFFRSDSLRSEKEFKAYLALYKKSFLKKIDEYLNKSLEVKLTITGTESEVISRVRSKTTQKRKTKAKKVRRRRHRS